MSFVHPERLLWLLLALPILLLYLSFLRRKHEVSTSIFWRRALARRAMWPRWRRLVSLAVQLAVLATIVAALAEPYWTSSTRRVRYVLLLVDTSASMSATDVSPSRLEKAVDDARRFLNVLPLQTEAAVISTGGKASVLCGFSRDRKTWSDALARIAPTDAPNSMGTAVDLARRMMKGKPQGRIVICSDGGFDKAKEYAQAKNIDLYRYAGQGDNVGITQLEVRTSPIEPQRLEVLVEVRNFSLDAVTCGLEIFLQGDAEPETLQQQSLELAPQATYRDIIAFERTQVGLLTARLDRDDDLVADNLARTFVSPGAARHVTLVESQDEGFASLQSAIEALPTIELTMTDKSLPDSMTVFHGGVPKSLPRSAVLAVAPQTSCDLWEFVSSVEVGPVTMQKNSPLLSRIDLTDVVLGEIVQLKFSGPAETLAATADGEPVVSLLPRDGGDVLVLHARLDRGDLALRETLPLLVSNAVERLSGGGEIFRRTATTQDQIHLQGGDDSRQLRSPAGTMRKLVGRQAATVTLPHVGLWSVVDDQDKPSMVMASSLLNARESDLQADPKIGKGEMETQGWGRIPLWFFFVVLAVLMTSLDWFFFHRRVLI